MVARIAGASQVRLIGPGYATIEIDLKHEKAAGDRESVKAAEGGRRARCERGRARGAPARAASLRENIEYVMDGLRSAAARARSQAGSKTRVTYSLPPERDDGYRRGPSVVCATVPQGTVATTVASDWLANELAGRGKIDAACRDRMVMHLMRDGRRRLGAGRRRVQVHGWRGDADRGRRRGHRLRGVFRRQGVRLAGFTHILPSAPPSCYPPG
mmetsp:Transcript_27509/g.88492  ORF Transcript_27509/g.88492 Transcript_27509/m.88492 type:complete len:214 (-) Transcript_27509:1488-2129(-)